MSGYLYRLTVTADLDEIAQQLFDELRTCAEYRGGSKSGASVSTTLYDRGAAKDLAWRWLTREGVSAVSVDVSPHWTEVGG